MATRKQLMDDAVKSIVKYIPVAGKTDYMRLILGQGDVTKAAITTDAAAASREKSLDVLSKALDPAISSVNGGKFTHEIAAEFVQALAGITDQKEKESKIPRFVRFTLPEAIRKSTPTLTKPDSAYVVSNDQLLETTIQTSSSKFFDLNQGYVDADFWKGMSQQPSKSNPSVGVIELLNSRIGPAVRDTSELSVFCSMVPAHIMSRAVPYLTVRLQNSGSLVGSGDSYAAGSLNLIRYLRGKTPVKSTDVGSGMVFTLNGGVAREKQSGMELFTSPQTLVSNHDDLIGSAFDGVKPVDRFRPFMTITSLSIEVVPAKAGMLNYKKGSLELILHDRGRLAEIAPLVKPGGYSDIEIELDYGWSIDPRSSVAMPGEGGSLTGFALQDDKIAQFVDSLKITEKYQVVNSTFKFDDAGQVNISMTIFMKGTFDMRSIDISGDETKEFAKKIKEVLAKINEAIAGSAGRAQAVFGETLINSVASPEEALQIDPKALEELLAKVTKLQQNSSTSDDLKKLAGQLNSVFGKDGDLAQYKTKSASAVDKKMGLLKGSPEIFITSADQLQKKTLKQAYESSMGGQPVGENFTETVSFGKLMLAFVAVPLAKTKKYDEVQLVFGKFNDRAGMMRNLSIAAFPFDVKRVNEKLAELYGKNVNVGISQFMGEVGTNFLNYHANEAYGFSTAYDKEGKLNADPGKGQGVVDKALAAAGITDLNFVMPEISVNAECIPHDSDPTKTILRITAFDESCNPYQTFSEALNSARTDSTYFVDVNGLEAFQPLFKAKSWPDIRPEYIVSDRKSTLKSMVDAGVLKAVKTVDVAKSAEKSAIDAKIDLASLFTTKDWRAVKKYFSESVPSIRYGTSAGMVKSLALSSISSPALVNINITKSNETGGETEAASSKKGIPLTIAPTEVQVEMLGCPIVSYGQMVYVDFGTNTSADNIYACIGISHRIEAGSYTTSMKLTGIGTYGVYASSVRNVEITKKTLEQYLEGGGENFYSEVVQGKPISYKWEELPFTSEGYEKALAAEKANRRSSKKSNPTTIRWWPTLSVSPSDCGTAIPTTGKNGSAQLSDSTYNKNRDDKINGDQSAQCVEFEVVEGIAGTILSVIVYQKGVEPTQGVINMTSWNEYVNKKEK